MLDVNDVKTKLIAAIDKTRTIPQEELNQIFAKVRMHLDGGVLLLSSICTFPQKTFLHIASCVMNGEAANKAFYKRSANLALDTFITPSKDSARKIFLCDAMSMMSAMVRNDLPVQQRLLVRHNLTRNIFEDAIDDFLRLCGRYEYHAEAACTQVLDQQFLHAQELATVEARLGATRPYFFYGALRYLRRLRTVIRTMYARVLEAYTRIVLQAAKRTAGSIAQESDSFQHGSLGLLRAISLYDHCSYMRFSNFAPLWIKQSILYQIKDTANTVRVPLNIWQQSSQLEKSRVLLEAKFGALSHEELADRLGLTAKSVSSIYTAIKAAHPESIDAPTSASRGGGNARSRHDTRIPNAADSSPHALSDVFDTRVDDIRDILDAGARTALPLQDLAYREQVVMCLNYGLMDQLPQKPDTSEDQRVLDVLIEKYRQRSLRPEM